MNSLLKISICWALLSSVTAHAQLNVTVALPKVTGSKVVVPLAIKNSFAEKIESARAVVFLLDEQGKLIGQDTRWVIGGSENKPALAAGATNSFHFVIQSAKAFNSTNLTTKVSFTRIVLEGGKLADINMDVLIE